MKIFKNWKDDISGFVIFLGKDVIAQKRRMRKLHDQYYKKGDPYAYKQYNIQLGVAMQSSSMYNIAKVHFNLDSFKRKHINNKDEKEKI